MGGGGGDHSTARVSMHIHASPTHRLTATKLQRETGEMVEQEWGMDKGGGEGGRQGEQEGRSVSEYSQHLLEVSGLDSCVWGEMQTGTQQIFNWSAVRCVE